MHIQANSPDTRTAKEEAPVGISMEGIGAERAAEARRLVDLLSSRKQAVREEAIRGLREMGTDATAALLEALENDRRKRAQSLRKMWILVGVVAALTFVTAATFAALGYHSLTGITGLSGLIGFYGASIVISRQAVTAAALLGAIGDPRAIPFLIEAYGRRDTIPHVELDAALTRLLPLMQGEPHAEMALTHQILLAQRMLQKDAAPGFALAVCDALARVGLKQVAPTLDALIARRAEDPRWAEVVEAARRARTAIERRVEEQRHHGQLLRPSAPAQNSDLLRPAGPGEETNSQTLLRPTADGPAAENTNP